MSAGYKKLILKFHRHPSRDDALIVKALTKERDWVQIGFCHVASKSAVKAGEYGLINVTLGNEEATL